MGKLVSCVVLAGGQSTRMGRAKAFIEILGCPMIEWTLQALAGLSPETILVVNDPERFAYLGHRLVCDLYPDQGALGGLYTGLASMAHERAMVVACDMPFLNRDLLAYQASLADHSDAVVPRIGEYLEPLHAVYSRACLPALENTLNHGRHRFGDFFNSIHLRYVEQEEIDRFDPQHRSFINVNTLADLDAVRRLAAQLYGHNPQGIPDEQGVASGRSGAR